MEAKTALRARAPEPAAGRSQRRRDQDDRYNLPRGGVASEDDLWVPVPCDSIGFSTDPALIMLRDLASSAFKRAWPGTDHPSATVTIVRRGSEKRVLDEIGIRPVVLWALEQAVENAGRPVARLGSTLNGGSAARTVPV